MFSKPHSPLRRISLREHRHQANQTPKTNRTTLKVPLNTLTVTRKQIQRTTVPIFKGTPVESLPTYFLLCQMEQLFNVLGFSNVGASESSQLFVFKRLETSETFKETEAPLYLLGNDYHCSLGWLELGVHWSTSGVLTQKATSHRRKTPFAEDEDLLDLEDQAVPPCIGTSA